MEPPLFISIVIRESGSLVSISMVMTSPDFAYEEYEGFALFELILDHVKNGFKSKSVK